MKKLLMFMMASLFIFALAACSDGESEEEGSTELKVWAPAEEQELLVDLAAMFKEDYPEYDVTFDFRTMGVEASIDSLRRDPSEGADVFMYPSGGIAEMNQAGLLLEFTMAPDSIRNMHTENAVAATSQNGSIYGVPVAPNAFFLYYNASLYTESEVASLNTMMDKDLGEDIENFSMPLQDSWYLSSFFLGAGCTLFGEDGTDATQMNFSGPCGIDAGNYLIDLVNNPKYIEDESGLAGSLMREGKLGAFTSGVWAASNIKDQMGEDYAVAKLPTYTVDGNTYQMKSFVDYKAYGVNSSTEAPEEALVFARYLSSETAQMIRFEENSEAPTIESLLDHPQVQANAEVSALLEQTPISKPQPVNAKLTDFWTPMNTFGSELVNGDITKNNLQTKLEDLEDAVLS